MPSRQPAPTATAGTGNDAQDADRKWIPRLLIGILLGVAVWAGLLFYGDAAAIIEASATVSPRVLLLALFLSTLNYIVRIFRWQNLLQTVGVNIPMAESATVCLAGLSMTLTPMKVGELLKSALLKQSRGISVATTAPVVMAERITDLAAMVLLASLGSLSLDKGYYVAVAGGFFVAAIMAVCTIRPVGEAALGLCAHLPILKNQTDSLADAYKNLGALVAPRPFVLATMLGILAWGTHCFALLVLVRSFPGVDFTVSESLFAYSTPLLAGTLSMLPGGLGLTEASMTGLLQEFGGPAMPPAIAAASTILIRLVTFWWAIIVGLAALTLWRRRY
ncbi:MAG: uncharacterized membrane protein YbhN (UPF0104 family) [Myxococcota bacterium]|jgi:uncharacterized membrane protein YbhN (UPF0104 family)